MIASRIPRAETSNLRGTEKNIQRHTEIREIPFCVCNISLDQSNGQACHKMKFRLCGANNLYASAFCRYVTKGAVICAWLQRVKKGLVFYHKTHLLQTTLTLRHISTDQARHKILFVDFGKKLSIRSKRST